MPSTLPSGAIRLEANRSLAQDGRFELLGDVDIMHDQRRLQADRILYDRSADRAEADGHVRFTQPGFTLRAQSGYSELEGQRAEFLGVVYSLPKRGARGGAERVQRIDPARTRLEQATYTTCPPERKDWELSADEIALDQESGRGTARGVKLRFKDVPVFYAPRFSFPIDDRRKSGFLMPGVGSSDESGTELSIPFYWNIAPNRDATITPRLLSRRGVQLIGEYRYLRPNSHGRLGVEFLSNDDRYGSDRSLFSYRHHGRFGPRWRTDVQLAGVSDDQYFEDLGQSLSLSSTTHLQRRVELRYRHPYWSALGRLQDFQALEGATPTYARLPQLQVTARVPGGPPGLTYRLNAEAVRFDHADAGSVPTGTRVDLHPGIEYRWGGPGAYLTPALSVRHTAYSLDDPGAGNPDNPSRTTPILALDGGLFFERSTTGPRGPMIQTLEPRLYYLYVPHEEQTDLPVFDTARPDFSILQLFRENRFNGADRQGDANQLTLAITSRMLDTRTGRERLRASVGEIFYFENREVVLPGEAVETENRSALIAELDLRLWRYHRVGAGLQWDPEAEEADKSVFRYQYRDNRERIFNIGYRFRRNDLEQTDVSVLWPVHGRWRALGRWNYSLEDERTLEAFAGLEYDGCCWLVRLVAREHVNATGGETDRGVHLQFVFKGLTRVGSPIEDLMERGILGYEDRSAVEY